MTEELKDVINGTDEPISSGQVVMLDENGKVIKKVLHRKYFANTPIKKRKFEWFTRKFFKTYYVKKYLQNHKEMYLYPINKDDSFLEYMIDVQELSRRLKISDYTLKTILDKLIEKGKI